MLDQTEILLKCAEILWAYRAELEYVWPLPNTLDSLRFAVTEVGEALDADLRLNQEYARNRDKELSVEDELADALMMLLTALGKDEPLFYGGKPDPITLEAIMLEVALATFCHSVDRDAGQPYASGDAWHDYARTAIDMIVSYPGMDLPQRLTQRLERIRAKRLREVYALPKNAEGL